MKSNLLHQCALLAIAFWLSACAKDVDKFIPDPVINYTGDINHFFEAIDEDRTQTTTINIDFPTAVVTPRKTVLIFQPKSLLDAQGNAASGYVKIHITELLTRGEILLYGIPTHSRGKLLSSAGEFFVTATQDDVPLRLKPGAPVRILTDVSGTPKTRMELFYKGTDLRDDGTPFDTWDEADGNPNSWDNISVTAWVALADSQQIITGYGYECFSDSLNWINFDMFESIPQAQKTDVCITLPQEYGNVNTVIYMVFHDLHSVVMLPGDPLSKTFCNFYKQSVRLPVLVGSSVSFIVISEQANDTYFYAQVKTTLDKDHSQFILPQPTDLEVIKSSILKL